MAEQEKEIESPTIIYNDFKELFPKNCISCKKGWYSIIYQMCSTIHFYVEQENPPEDKKPYFTKIEEKFGVLNIEIENSDSVIELIRRATEKISWHTCEYCSEPGELYCSSKYKSWSYLKTLCLDHAIELYYYRLYKSPTT